MSTNNIRKPKGRRSPYIYFIQDYQKQLKKKNCKIPFEESSKLCAAKWKHLPEEEKSKYKKMAEADACRYRREMGVLKGRLTTRQLRRLKRKRKDPTAPVRPLSAYMWFCKTMWKKVSEENPGMSFTETRKELAKRWKKCNARAKERFELMADYDRKYYQAEKEEHARQKTKKKTGKDEKDGQPK